MQFGINLKRLPRKLQICLSDVPRAINGCLVTHPGIWIGMISNNVKYFLRNGNIRSSIKRIKGFRKWDTYLTIFSMHSMQKFLLYHYCYVLYCVFCRQVGNISLSNSWKRKQCLNSAQLENRICVTTVLFLTQTETLHIHPGMQLHLHFELVNINWFLCFANNKTCGYG